MSLERVMCLILALDAASTELPSLEFLLDKRFLSLFFRSCSVNSI